MAERSYSEREKGKHACYCNLLTAEVARILGFSTGKIKVQWVSVDWVGVVNTFLVTVIIMNDIEGIGGREIIISACTRVMVL